MGPIWSPFQRRCSTNPFVAPSEWVDRCNSKHARSEERRYLNDWVRSSDPWCGRGLPGVFRRRAKAPPRQAASSAHYTIRAETNERNPRIAARENARIQHQAILMAPHECWGNVGSPRLPKSKSAAVLNGDVGYLEPNCDSVWIVGHSDKGRALEKNAQTANPPLPSSLRNGAGSARMIRVWLF